MASDETGGTSSPKYIIDLTVDSPVAQPRSRSSRLRRSCQNSKSEPPIYVLDDDPVDQTIAPPPPKKKVLKAKTKTVETKSATDAITIAPTNEETPVVPVSICAICLDDLTNRRPMATRCGHLYCSECLDTHLKMSLKCPTCKSKITRKSCIRIHF